MDWHSFLIPAPLFLSYKCTLAEDRDRQPLPRIPWMLGIRAVPLLVLLAVNASHGHQCFTKRDNSVFSPSCFQKLLSCRFEPDLSCTYGCTSLYESHGHFWAEHCSVWALQGGPVLSITYIKWWEDVAAGCSLRVLYSRGFFPRAM